MLLGDVCFVGWCDFVGIFGGVGVNLVGVFVVMFG